MAIPSGITIGWPSTVASLPDGWDRVTALDGKHLKQIPDSSTDPGSTGGNAQHHHATDDHQHTIAHTHVTGGSTAAASGSAQHASTSGVDSQTNLTHTHTVGVVASSTDSTPTDANSHPNSEDKDLDPARWDTIFIASDGTPTTIPEGAVTWFSTSTLPTSWTQPANGKDKFLRGAAASGDGGGTGGGAVHSHAGGSHAHISDHVHPSGTTGNGPNVANNAAGSTIAAGDNHNHTYSVVTNNFGSSVAGNLATSGDATAAATEPPWIKLAHITPPAGGDTTRAGIIAAWLGLIANIPSGWALCDGNNGTPNLCQGKFTKGANLLTELLSTGGNANHTHTGANHTHTWSNSAHTHTLTVDATTNIVGETGSAITASSPGHTHATTTSSAASAVTVGNAAPSLLASTDNDPAYVEVAFIQQLNIQETAGDSDGVATVSGTAQAIHLAAGSSTGAATVTAVGADGAGADIVEGAGTATGAATVEATAQAIAQAAGSSTGAATITAVAQALALAGGASSGQAIVESTAQAIAQAVGASQGQTTVTATGVTRQIIEAAGTIAAAATVTAVGADAGATLPLSVNGVVPVFETTGNNVVPCYETTLAANVVPVRVGSTGVPIQFVSAGPNVVPVARVQ